MNREIKFRGQDLKTKEWIYGDLIRNAIIDPFTYIAIGIGYKVDDERIGKPIKVYPNTVGQYTGSKDKDGKEIYEGDILKGGTAENGVVTFENGTFTVWGMPLGWDVENFGYEELPSVAPPELWAEVIGNISDNPESLQ